MKTKSLVHGIPRATKSKPPVIEILGPPGCGKQMVGKLVARQLGGEFLNFPVLRPDSPTGRLLWVTLVPDPSYLERNPGWWSHIYAANVLEFADRIDIARTTGPVVVANYVHSFRYWHQAAFKTAQTLTDSFFPGVVQPTDVFVLTHTPEWRPPGDIYIDWAIETKQRIRRALNSIVTTKIKKIECPDTPWKHVQLNGMANAITNTIKEKYKLPTLDIQYESTDA